MCYILFLKVQLYKKLKLDIFDIFLQASSVAGFLLGTFNLYHNINQQQLIDNNSDMIRMLKTRVDALEANPVLDTGKKLLEHVKSILDFNTLSKQET